MMNLLVITMLEAIGGDLRKMIVEKHGPQMSSAPEKRRRSQGL